MGEREKGREGELWKCLIIVEMNCPEKYNHIQVEDEQNRMMNPSIMYAGN